MTLTEQQTKAVQLAIHLAQTGEVGALLGYAGTGKTTVLKTVAEEVDGIVMLAPTGRAALRITEATGIMSSTIHRWAYKVVPSDDDVAFELRGEDEIECPSGGLIIVDEGSMVTTAIDLDLRKLAARHGCGLLYVGDPFQLPPVGDVGCALDAFCNDTPNTVILTEIHRQALDSVIIRTSMRLRRGEGKAALDELETIRKGSLIDSSLDVLDSGGVVVTHSNKLRQLLNLKIRTGYGLKESDIIVPGERLIVLRNNYAVNRFNGELLTFSGFTGVAKPVAISDYRANVHTTIHLATAVVGGNEVYICMEEIWGALGGIQPYVIAKAIKHWMVAMAKAGNGFRWLPYLSVNLGYALTGHKCQGSEYPSVAIMMEWQVKPDTDEGARWLYTAITRAQRSVVLGYVGRGPELVAHSIRPLRAAAVTGAALAKLPHILVFNDSSGIVRKKLEEKLVGRLLVDVDLKLEDKGRAPDFERAPADYVGGLVVVAAQDGSYSKRALRCTTAFLDQSRTVMTWALGALVQVRSVVGSALLTVDGQRLVAHNIVEQLTRRISKLATLIADGAATDGERKSARLAMAKAKSRLAMESAAHAAMLQAAQGGV